MVRVKCQDKADETLEGVLLLFSQNSLRRQRGQRRADYRKDGVARVQVVNDPQVGVGSGKRHTVRADQTASNEPTPGLGARRVTRNVGLLLFLLEVAGIHTVAVAVAGARAAASDSGAPAADIDAAAALPATVVGNYGHLQDATVRGTTR